MTFCDDDNKRRTNGYVVRLLLLYYYFSCLNQINDTTQKNKVTSSRITVWLLHLPFHLSSKNMCRSVSNKVNINVGRSFYLFNISCLSPLWPGATFVLTLLFLCRKFHFKYVHWHVFCHFCLHLNCSCSVHVIRATGRYLHKELFKGLLCHQLYYLNLSHLFDAAVE